MNSNNNLEHHKRYEYCRTRLKYRQSKELTAVKVYTVANESTHLLIFGVPKINLYNELKRSLSKFGTIIYLKCMTDTLIGNNNKLNFKIEQFTDVYHIKYDKIHQSRKCKKFFDAKNFYGGILHISYATEYETINDIRLKLLQRKNEINYRIKFILNKNENNILNNSSNNNEPKMKCKKIE